MDVGDGDLRCTLAADPVRIELILSLDRPHRACRQTSAGGPRADLLRDLSANASSLLKAELRIFCSRPHSMIQVAAGS